MTNHRITEIIEQLEDELSNTKILLEIRKSTLDPDEKNLAVHANKQGIVNLAIALLNNINEAHNKSEDIVYVDIVKLASITKGDFVINNIVIESEKVENIIEEEYEETLKDKLVGWFIMSVFVGLLICLIYGLVSILKIIYNILF